MSIVIRPARQDEMDELTDLVYRSKAHWGYDDEFMSKASADLVVNEKKLSNTWVAEVDGDAVAVVVLMPIDEDIDLDMFFVDPPAIGTGVGRKLWAFALEQARAMRGRKLIVVSEPNAEEFYLRMGAVRVGESFSNSTQRNLPLLEFDL
jgi:GNAT superfamily N-acetyltransferase